MISFPNAKINLGLRIIKKRTDGYHDIETIFYPVLWSDALEFIPKKGTGKINLQLSGIALPGQGTNQDNLCVRLYQALAKKYKLPSVDVWLHKTIPIGAGLGGGSSDAVQFLMMLNQKFKLNLTVDEMKNYAVQLGSDCPFFLHNKPMIAAGKGEIIKPVKLNLGSWHVAIVHPGIVISTAEAYKLVTPSEAGESLLDIVTGKDLKEWKDCLVNDFETPILKLHPLIGGVKEQLYKSGALYASMTGSGSAVYGIYEKEPNPSALFPDFKTWKGRLTLPQ